MSLRRLSHFKDPKIEQQMEELRRATSDDELRAHSEQNGGTHGLGPGQVFESQQGAQQKANNAKADAVIEAKAYVDSLLGAGPTADRPDAPPKGFMYFDFDLGLPVWWNGGGWVDATGVIV